MEHVFTIPDAIAEYQERAGLDGPVPRRVHHHHRPDLGDPVPREPAADGRRDEQHQPRARSTSRRRRAAPARTPPPRRGSPTNAPTVVVNPTTGAVTGPALQALRQQLLTPETRKRSAADALQYFTSLGITTHGDSGAFHAELPSNGIASENTYTMHFPFMELQRERKLPARLRIDFLHQDSATDDPPLPTLAPRLRNSFQFFGDDWMRTAGIGEFTGGGIPGLVAIGRAGWRGEDHSLSLNNFLTLVVNRQQAHDQLVAEGFPDGITKLRWRISHVPGTTDDVGEPVEGAGRRPAGGLGPDARRAARQPIGPAYRTLYDNGIPLGWHSDGGDITVISPWLNLYATITGKSLRGMHDAGHAAGQRGADAHPPGSAAHGHRGEQVVHRRERPRLDRARQPWRPGGARPRLLTAGSRTRTSRASARS